MKEQIPTLHVYIKRHIFYRRRRGAQLAQCSVVMPGAISDKAL